MAIALRGTANEERTGPGSGTYANLTLPASLAENDYVVAWVSNPNGANPSWTEDSGTWTLVADLYFDDTSDANTGMFRKIMGGTPDSTVSITQSSGNNSATFISAAYSGVDTTTPHDVAAVTATGGNSPDANPGSITPVTAGARLLACGSSSENTGTVTFPSGYGNNVDEPHSSAGVRSCFADKAWSGSGADDPGTFDVSAGSTADSWNAVTIALRPAASAGPVLNANPFMLLGVGRKLP